MTAASMLLVLAAAVVLVLGIVVAPPDDLTLVWASIGMSLAAAVLLAGGVARARPRARGAGPVGASWSGAATRARAGGASFPDPDQAAEVSWMLQEVPGLGPAERADLRTHFRDPERLRQARLDELMEVPGITREIAERVHHTLHGS